MFTLAQAHPLVSRLLVALCILIHLGLTLLLFDNLWDAVSPFDGSPINGAFQNYNALRRLDAGQRPGQDFVVFHGVGGPLLQYPYFKLLGSDLAASEITRQFLRPLQVVFVVLLFSWFFRLGWGPSLLLWPLAIGTVVRGYFFHNSGNSSLEYRSLFPIIVVGFILAPRDIPWRAVWIGIAGAIALLCSVEQGLAAIVAGGISVLAAAAASWRKPAAWRLLKETLLGLGLAVLLMFLVWFAIGGPPAVVTCLTFYFDELANDQFWFFGGPLAAVFDGHWRNQERFFAVILVALPGFCLSWFAYRKASSDASCRLAIGLMTLFAYSVLALASYLGNATTVAQSFRAIMAAAVCIAIAAWNARFGDTSSARPTTFWWRTAIFALVASSPLIITPFLRTQQHIGYSQGYDDDLAAFTRVSGLTPRSPGTAVIWSDYAGHIEDCFNVFHPDTDYLIHVLGPTRRASYVKKFAEVRPEFVTTYAPERVYTSWLRQSFWDFYRNLALDYEVVGRTRDKLIWKRKPDEAIARSETPWIDASTPDQGQTYTITCPREPGKIPLVEIKVAYSCENSLAKIPLLGKLPRFFIDPSKTLEVLPVSLPPYKQEFVFPMSPASDSDIELRYHVESLINGASLTVHSIQYRVIAQLVPGHGALRAEPVDPIH